MIDSSKLNGTFRAQPESESELLTADLFKGQYVTTEINS